MCKKFDISPITAMVNIHKKSLSRTMATYFQSSRTLLESSARLTLSLSILDLKIYLHTHTNISTNNKQSTCMFHLLLFPQICVPRLPMTKYISLGSMSDKDK